MTNFLNTMKNLFDTKLMACDTVNSIDVLVTKYEKFIGQAKCGLITEAEAITFFKAV